MANVDAALPKQQTMLKASAASHRIVGALFIPPKYSHVVSPQNSHVVFPQLSKMQEGIGEREREMW